MSNFYGMEFLDELWQNHQDPSHAVIGIGGVIVLMIIYNLLLNKFQKYFFKE